MLAVYHHARNLCVQHPRNELRQFPIPQHGCLAKFHCINLLEYFASRCQWLNEHRLFVTDTVRHDVKILHRKRQILRVSPGMADDSEHRAMLTMTLQATPAKIADGTASQRLAGDIDFPANAPPQTFFLFRSLYTP